MDHVEKKLKIVRYLKDALKVIIHLNALMEDVQKVKIYVRMKMSKKNFIVQIIKHYVKMVYVDIIVV